MQVMFNEETNRVRSRSRSRITGSSSDALAAGRDTRDDEEAGATQRLLRGRTDDHLHLCTRVIAARYNP